MRTMYDAIVPAHIPAGARMVASYVDGNWPYYDECVRLFPDAVHVSISTQGADAQVMDIEFGNLGPGYAPAWCERQRARGQWPSVYCNDTVWPDVVKACQAAGVELPEWWEASWNGRAAELSPGSVAHQYDHDLNPGYDISVVADYWRGIDPEEPDMTPAQEQMLRELHDEYMKRRAAEDAANYATTQLELPALAAIRARLGALDPSVLAAACAAAVAKLPGVGADPRAIAGAVLAALVAAVNGAAAPVTPAAAPAAP